MYSNSVVALVIAVVAFLAVLQPASAARLGATQQTQAEQELAATTAEALEASIRASLSGNRKKKTCSSTMKWTRKCSEMLMNSCLQTSSLEIITSTSYLETSAKRCPGQCVCKNALDYYDEEANECVSDISECTTSCSGDLVWTTCGSACPKNCAGDTEVTNTSCITSCVSACRCPNNQYQNVDTNLCYDTFAECKAGTKTDELSVSTCDGDLEYNECGSSCSQACTTAEPDTTLVCTTECVEKCQCPSDTPYLNPTTNSCYASYDTCYSDYSSGTTSSDDSTSM